MPEETSTPKPRVPRKTTPKDGRSADCTPAENQMWKDVLDEKPCRLDLEFTEESERHIRASEFCKLCRSGGVSSVGITLYGAIFDDELNLSNCDFSFGLDLDKCTFTSGIDLAGSSIRYLFLERCLVKGSLNAQSINISGSVYLRNNFVAMGQVYFNSAKIGGQLDCSKGQFNHEGENCLHAQNIDVSGSIYLRDGFVAMGQVDFASAKIGGQLDCSKGQFNHEGGKCIYAQNIDVSGGVFLRDGFVAMGQVDFASAKIGGQLSCMKGKFNHKGENCLVVFNIDVSQDVFLRDGFVAMGQVNFNSAKIRGHLDCSKGQFNHEGENCIYAQNIDVSGGVFLRDGFVAMGQVDFANAKIGGQLSCVNGKFNHKGEKCFHAQNIDVSGSVFLRNGFVAMGQVDFANAKIGGQLDCLNGKFVSTEVSLVLWKAKIELDVFFSTTKNSPFCANGILNLSEVKILGNLVCGAEILGQRRFNEKESAGEFHKGIQLDGAEIAGTFYFAPKECSGFIDLSHATLGGFVDRYALVDSIPRNWWDAKKCDIRSNFRERLQLLFPWVPSPKQTPGDNQQKQYRLYGLRYKALSPKMCEDWRELVEWIRNADNGEYHPQPYERLAAVLQAQGHENEASEVLIARRRHRLKNLTWLRRLTEIVLYDNPILFGYKPWQAVYIATAFILFGWWSFYQADSVKLFVPNDGDVLTKSVENREKFVAEELHQKFKLSQNINWDVQKQNAYDAHPLSERDENGKLHFIPDGYPEVCAFIYSLDTFLPIVDLQQNSYWLPDRSKPGGMYYWVIYWILDIMGWFLTTLLVASLSGLVRDRNSEVIEP